MTYRLSDGRLDAPADPSDVGRLSSGLGVVLPSEYLAFLRQHNGGEGFIGNNYIILWKAEELADFNREYEVESYAPGIFLFGSNGGGEAYGFDTRSTAMPIVRTPFIGMECRYATPVAKDLPDLFAQARDFDMSSHRNTCPRGMEVVEIMPIILGGDPADPLNKTLVTRQQHFELVRYWNKVIVELRKQGE